MARTWTWTRRDVVRAAAAMAVVGLRPGRDARAGATAGKAGLPPGLPLGPCRLIRELPARAGAWPFELRDSSGQTFVVEVHRRDHGAPGLARAGSLDVYLRNGGTGSTPTREDHGLGAMALASALAEREASGAPLPRLDSIVERWQRDPPPRR